MDARTASKDASSTSMQKWSFTHPRAKPCASNPQLNRSKMAFSTATYLKPSQLMRDSTCIILIHDENERLPI
jgi:hypothetical protein